LKALLCRSVGLGHSLTAAWRIKNLTLQTVDRQILDTPSHSNPGKREDSRDKYLVTGYFLTKKQEKILSQGTKKEKKCSKQLPLS
jgi:hypothetical protein